MKTTITRRTFVKKTTGSIAAASALGLANSPMVAEEKSDTDVQFRELGRTGLKYTVVGFGGMRTRDPAVFRRAVEMGINNIDTARKYMGGENEKIVAEAINGLRDKVHITTKIKPGSYEKMMSDAEQSLKSLETDYIDVMLIHSMKTPDDLHEEERLKFITKVKEQGKARFIGFSTHSNMTELLNTAAKDKFFDVILTVYNFKQDEPLGKAIAAAAEAGIGILAMKTQAGGYEHEDMGDLSPHQASLKYVLSDTNVTAAIPAMTTFDQLNENFGVMKNVNFGWMDRKTLYRYGKVIDHELCRMCGECEKQCPYNAPVPDMNRCLMYAEGYGDVDLARETFEEITASQSIPCSSCPVCTVNCPNGLDVNNKIKRTLSYFA